ncbi:MAG TPA: hypothetical protein VI758_01605 [Bacteroidota bacterium]
MEEEKTIIIEIRQEVAVMLLFLAAGVLLVYAAYSVPHRSPELWPALNAGGLATAVYLIALLFYILRKPLPTKVRTIAAVIAFVVMSSTAFAWIRFQEQTRWQADQMSRIRGLIDQGVRESTMPRYLLVTLDSFYHQPKGKRKTLGEVFQQLNNNAVVGTNIYTPQFTNDPFKICVRTLAADRIVIVSAAPVSKGRDPRFNNYDGRIGMCQDQYTLTERGITHESEN